VAVLKAFPWLSVADGLELSHRLFFGKQLIAVTPFVYLEASSDLDYYPLVHLFICVVAT